MKNFYNGYSHYKTYLILRIPYLTLPYLYLTYTLPFLTLPYLMWISEAVPFPRSWVCKEASLGDYQIYQAVGRCRPQSCIFHDDRLLWWILEELVYLRGDSSCFSLYFL